MDNWRTTPLSKPDFTTLTPPTSLLDLFWESDKATIKEPVIEKYERDVDLRGADLPMAREDPLAIKVKCKNCGLVQLYRGQIACDRCKKSGQKAEEVRQRIESPQADLSEIRARLLAQRRANWTGDTPGYS